ncbi:MAG: TIGR03915 family putative DNA repair protein [Oscillospiraceae bacterium]|nr:TIGR03915 family putative DNA repair protein [Oscillospiraceae bacterium]
MSVQNTWAYEYDGSLDGFLCCVFDGFSRREDPVQIFPEQETQATLYPVRRVETDPTHAGRVWRSLDKKISPLAREWVEKGFLCSCPGKELLLYRFLKLGYQRGAAVTNMLGEPVVNRLFSLVRGISQEAHLLTGFVRFEDHQGVLAARIEPKGFVLPLIAPHFAGRFSGEAFLIHDLTHGAVLLHRPGEYRIIAAEHLELPPLSPGEAEFQRMWKGYYDAIAIRERENPRCRLCHMPRRYWAHMVEVSPRGPGDNAPCSPLPSQAVRALP